MTTCPCGRPVQVKVRGLCGRCALRVYRLSKPVVRPSAIGPVHGPRRLRTSPVWEFVKAVAVAPRTDECILWPFVKDRAGGYGRMKYRGKDTPTTRVVLELSGRPRPDETAIALHSCDNPPCVNPHHLRWGTYAENAADAYNRGRRDHAAERLYRDRWARRRDEGEAL